MLKNRKILIPISLILLLLLSSFYIQVDYFITSPGAAIELKPLVEVKGGYTDEEGTFMMTTVRMGRANLIGYLYGLFNPNIDLLPLEAVLKPKENEKEYFKRQEHVMEESQEGAVLVAFQKSGLPIEVEYKGAVVTLLMEEMPAEQVLQVGDLIVEADQQPIYTREELISILQGQPLGKKVPLKIIRDGKPHRVEVEVAPFPQKYQTDSEGKTKYGVGLINPETQRKVIPSKEVEFKTENVGGPSAGLMFSLEILNQLVAEDLTKGYHIAGTGEINEKGEVGRIGGVKHKVVAAHRQGAEIFFAPDDPGTPSNYEVAKQTAERLKLDIKVVPVKTIDDALNYLNSLPDK